MDNSHEYTVVFASKPGEMSIKITNLMKLGWTPVGGIAAMLTKDELGKNQAMLFQSMMRYIPLHPGKSEPEPQTVKFQPVEKAKVDTVMDKFKRIAVRVAIWVMDYRQQIIIALVSMLVSFIMIGILLSR